MDEVKGEYVNGQWVGSVTAEVEYWRKRALAAEARVPCVSRGQALSAYKPHAPDYGPNVKRDG